MKRNVGKKTIKAASKIVTAKDQLAKIWIMKLNHVTITTDKPCEALVLWNLRM